MYGAVDDPEDVGVEDREDDEGGCEDDVGGAVGVDEGVEEDSVSLDV